jgi:hypothetical protein
VQPRARKRHGVADIVVLDSDERHVTRGLVEDGAERRPEHAVVSLWPLPAGEDLVGVSSSATSTSAPAGGSSPETSTGTSVVASSPKGIPLVPAAVSSGFGSSGASVPGASRARRTPAEELVHRSSRVRRRPSGGAGVHRQPARDRYAGVPAGIVSRRCGTRRWPISGRRRYCPARRVPSRCVARARAVRAYGALAPDIARFPGRSAHPIAGNRRVGPKPAVGSLTGE